MVFLVREPGACLSPFLPIKNQELHPKTSEFFKEIARRIEQDGIDAWFDLDPKELLGTDAEDYEKLQILLMFGLTRRYPLFGS